MSAIPFIVWQKSGIKVDDEARNRIMADYADEPIEVMSIIGVYRTGKSSILNQIAEANAFKRGETTDACTKGIWILSNMLSR